MRKESVGRDIWLSARVAGQRIGVSPETITRRRVQWGSEHIAGRVRYKLLKLGGGKPQRRFLEADVYSLLEAPSETAESVITTNRELVPRFRNSNTPWRGVRMQVK